MKHIFPKDQLIELMKSHRFKFTDSEKITDLYFTQSDNPFDRWDVGSIVFNNNLLICIDKWEGIFIVRIGYDDGWVGGMSMGNCEYTFDLKTLTFESFKAAFQSMEATRLFCLVDKYGTGTIDKIHFRGTLQEIDTYAINHGYTMVESDFRRSWQHYVKGSIPQHHRSLSIYVLSSLIFKNIMNNKS